MSRSLSPKSARFALTYWDMRGIAEPLRLLLSHCFGVQSWDDKRLIVGPPPSYDKSKWNSTKNKLGLPFPNLPYLIDESTGLRMAQTRSIARYICRMSDQPSLLGVDSLAKSRADEATEAVMDAWDAMFKVTYMDDPRQPTHTVACHTQPDSDHCQSEFSADFPIKQRRYCTVDLPKRLQQWDAVFEGHKHVCGDSLTYADFFLCEFLEQNAVFWSKCTNKKVENLLNGLDNLNRILQHVQNLPSVVEYKSSNKFKFEPFHNRYSHFYAV